MALFSIDSEEEASRTIRDEPPTHFALKIKSFSFLSKSSFESYKSDSFEAGGHKWKLCLYPKGNQGRKVEGHISLYLEISETDSLSDSLSPGWEVHVFFRLLVLDQLRDKYFTRQDANGRAVRIRATRTQSGFDRFITLEEFNDPSKGYLINDTCVVGAEVFVHKESVVGKGQCMLMTPGPATCNHTWRIEKFSELVEECHSSQLFTAGGHNWRVELYPKGNAEYKGNSISLFLVLENPQSLLPSQGVYVEYELRVLNQLHRKHVEKHSENHWFNHSSKDWGFRNFLSLSILRDQSKGYLVKDVCIIQAHLLLIGAIEKLN